MEPRKAINLFNASRGHAIERQNYLDDLTAGPKRSNVGIEVPEQEPDVGRLSLRDDFSHPHRSDQHYHQAPFSGQRSHPQSHRGRQHQFVPFPQRNDMMRFAPPQRQPLRPPLFPTPPPETRLMRPPFPNQTYRGGNSGPMLPYPPPLPAYRFGEPWQDPNRHPLPFPPGGPVRNQSGPHRKHRHRGKKGPKNTETFNNHQTHWTELLFKHKLEWLLRFHCFCEGIVFFTWLSKWMLSLKLVEICSFIGFCQITSVICWLGSFYIFLLVTLLQHAIWKSLYPSIIYTPVCLRRPNLCCLCPWVQTSF